jgi:Plasmid pRiA4b ORF-3-like protein
MVEAQTYVFRASLNPKVYRDFEILSAKNLYDLGGAIVRIFGFDFDHAFGFYSKLTGSVFGSPVKYELFADMGESEARSVKRTRIVDAFPTVGAKMTFLFDYGDNWQSRRKDHAGSPNSTSPEQSADRPRSGSFRTAQRCCHVSPDRGGGAYGWRTS